MIEFQARSCEGTGSRGLLIQETFRAITLEPLLAEAARVVEEEADERSYRQTLASWPLKWRERWGRRANALEDLGLSWRLAEVRAFVEVREERQAQLELRRRRSQAVGSLN